MTNDIYTSPFKNIISHIHVLNNNDKLTITLSNDKELLTIGIDKVLHYVDTTEKRWKAKELSPFQTVQ